MLLTLVCVAALALVNEHGPAAEGNAVAADSEISQVIDQHVSEQLLQKGLTAAGRTDESTLLRRTMLDLAGRIPTSVEQAWTLQQPESERHTLLVERLLGSRDFELHHRNWLDELLLANRPYDDEFRAYLLAAVESRRPWDVIFREIMVAGTAEGPQKGAAQFLKTRVRQLDDLTNDTAILFFGVNISCAKCHDHPLVPDWKQDHFYGLQAFFQRTYTTRKQNTVAERPFGEVKFSTVKGEDRKAEFMFLTGEVVADRTPQFSDEERKQLEERIRKLERDDAEAEILVPEFRPREELVAAALRDNTQLFFAKNIVNRVWARLLGTGLVDPPDQLHSGNPASHPQLLDWLAGNLIANQYDLRPLIRGIVQSETYARSSVWESGSEPPPRQSFAVAQTRPLTPRQLAASLQVAIRNPTQWPAMDDLAEWTKRSTELENQANGWVREFEQPTAHFQIAVDEALFFANNDRVQNDLLRDSDDRLAAALKKIEDPQETIRLLWQTVLNREPDKEEQESASTWLNRDEAKRPEAIRQLIWALVAGPEFRFNY